jgi:DnaJ-class molecular chaperone
MAAPTPAAAGGLIPCPTCAQTTPKVLLNYYCPHCSGTGSVWTAQGGGPFSLPTGPSKPSTCPSCNGTGTGLAPTTTATTTIPNPTG